MKKPIKTMILEIDEAVGKCALTPTSEKEMLAALVNKSEDWKMRLEELEEDDEP